MKRPEIECEMRRRADAYRAQKFLNVDYYRIRRRLAYPLPIREVAGVTIPVPGIPNYPWSIWMVWALEERIYCLAWNAEHLDDRSARELVERDLEALAAWPVYRQLAGVDLCLGHAGRLLAKAFTCWTWLAPQCRSAIRQALQRIVEDEMPRVRERYGEFSSKTDIARLEKPNLQLHNIPFIGTVGVAMAAHALDHSAASSVNATVLVLVEAWLEARTNGLSEGACYDGYMLDFIADWLANRPEDERNIVFDDPQFESFLNECYMLTAPGSSWNIAPLSDVEPSPAQMPFHTSAQAKILAYRRTPTRLWYLNRLEAPVLRTDALAALYSTSNEAEGTIPAVGVQDAFYASVLRTGWEQGDVAVAIANSNSPAGHIHTDNGSLNIGSHMSWFITTPGYQQYMQTSERKFVLGITSRNTPTINGQAPTIKDVRTLQPSANCGYEIVLDLTNCYAPELQLDCVRRRVSLQANGGVVVNDTVEGAAAEGAAVESLAYHWNGHPDAAWWVEDGWASLHMNSTILWFTCEQAEIEAANLQRMRGSRGELTLVAPIAPGTTTIRWFFQFGNERPTRESVEESRAATTIQRSKSAASY